MALRSTKTLGGLAACGALLVGGWSLFGYAEERGTAEYRELPKPSEMSPVAKARFSGDSAYESGDYASARTAYLEVIEANKTNPDLNVQDEVAVSRIRLGYLHAKEGDFESARSVFLEAAEDYAGNGYNSEFGTLPEQATYQAAVCLVAEGRGSAAERAFVTFIEENPHSALTQAAFRRLVQLNDGEAKAEHQALVQRATTAREAYQRRQQALCGPKAVAEVLRRLSISGADLDEIAKRCETTDSGTTMAGMIKALESFDLKATGYRLAYRDLKSLSVPAIWLQGDHYLVIISVDGRKIEIFDPASESISSRTLPEKDLHRYTLDILKITREKQ